MDFIYLRAIDKGYLKIALSVTGKGIDGERK
jgi:hypothetical protein